MRIRCGQNPLRGAMPSSNVCVTIPANPSWVVLTGPRCTVIIYVVITMRYELIGSDLAVDRTIQRFLQWAEHDMEETQRLNIRSPHTELPGSPES